MALSFVASATGSNNANGVTTVTAGSALNLQAGDTLFAVVEAEGADNSETLTLQKDSGTPTNAFTFDANKRGLNPGTCLLAMGYLESVAADATATFKLTLGTARDFPRIIILQFRGGMALDTNAFSISSGSSTAANSGNFNTTVANSIACGAYANDSGSAATAEQINGIAADGSVDADLNTAGAWYRILSSTFTNGAASATCGNISWACGGLSFKEVAGAPTYSLTASPGAYGV